MSSPIPTGSSSGAAPSRARTVQDYDAQFAAATGDALALAGGLTEAQGGWRPGPDRWSIAECVAHLAATGRLYLPVVVDAVRRGRAANRVAPGPFRPGLVGRWIVASMEPPPRRPMRTPPAIAPRRLVPLSGALSEFAAVQDALRAQVGAAAGLDLEGVRLRSPVMPVLRLSLVTCCGVLAAHERRHLWQARAVRADPSFPAA